MNKKGVYIITAHHHVIRLRTFTYCSVGVEHCRNIIGTLGRFLEH